MSYIFGKFTQQVLIDFVLSFSHLRNQCFMFCLLVMITSVFRVLVSLQYAVKMDTALQDRALTGFAFRNLTMTTVMECFLACFEDCLCLSFQMCNRTECHLLSSSQIQSTLDTMPGCTYYDMLPTTSEKVRNPSPVTNSKTIKALDL